MMIALSYVTSGLLVILSFMILVREHRIEDVSLSFGVVFLALIELFDQLALHSTYDPFAFKRMVLFLESLLPATFILFGVFYSRKRMGLSYYLPWFFLMGISLLFTVSSFVFPKEMFFASTDLRNTGVLLLGKVGYWFYLGLMIYCVVALVNLEATFSSTRGGDRWRIKFDFIGTASILAILIFYFSQGLLYRSINMYLIPVRSGVLLMAVIMIGYSKIFRGNPRKVAVSRYIFYRSFTLLIVGLYFLFLGLIGEGMRYFDISFSQGLAIFITFITGISFLVVLLSEKIRRKVKVFINKHFYAHKHDYREEWLGFSDRLSACRNIQDVQEAILTTFSQAFGTKWAALYLSVKEGAGFRLTARQGGGDKPVEIHVPIGMQGYFTEKGRVLNTQSDEYEIDPEESPEMVRTGAVLAVPLMSGKQIHGLVLLGEQIAPDELIYEDYDLMKTLAKQAAQSIVNYWLHEELAETRELAAVAKVSSFVIHDLKNLASALSLLLNNAEEYIENIDFQKDMIKSIRDTVLKMKGLIEKLKHIPKKHVLDLQVADVNALAEKTLEEIDGKGSSLEIIHEGTETLSMIDAAEIQKVLLNLVLNAIDATGGVGAVKLTVGTHDDMACLRVEDDGCGMTEEFVRDQLFKPFRTTKDKGLGIGLYQCKLIVEAHGGRIEVISRMGKGSVFTILLPVTGPGRNDSYIVNKVDTEI